jgi:hypothetical protein
MQVEPHCWQRKMVPFRPRWIIQIVSASQLAQYLRMDAGRPGLTRAFPRCSFIFAYLKLRAVWRSQRHPAHFFYPHFRT